MTSIEQFAQEGFSGETYQHVRRTDGRRWAGVWPDNTVYADCHYKPARVVQCHSRNQAISMAHRWCQGYDV